MQTIFNSLLTVTLITSIIIMTMLFLSPSLSKTYTAKWRYWIWLVLALRLFVPFNITLTQTPFQMSLPTHDFVFENQSKGIVTQAVQEVAAQDIILDNTLETYAPVIEAPIKIYVPIYQLFVIVWVVGILLYLTYQIICYLSFKKSVMRWSKPVSDSKITELAKLLFSEMRLNEIGIKISKKAHSPMIIGFIKPILLLPHEQYDYEDLSIILRHELFHYKRRDLWYKLLLLVVNAIHWFNPLVYIMVREAHKDIEITCDMEIVEERDLFFRKQYSEIILSVIDVELTKKHVLSTCFYGDKKSLRQRFTNILDMSKKRKGIISLLTVTVLILSIGLLVGFTTNNYKTANMQDPQTKNVLINKGINLLDTLNEPLSSIYNDNTVMLIKRGCNNPTVEKKTSAIDGFTTYYEKAVDEYKNANFEVSYENLGNALHYLIQINIPDKIMGNIQSANIVDANMTDWNFVYYKNNSLDAIGKSYMSYANDNLAALENGYGSIEATTENVSINAQRAISGILYKFYLDIQ